MVVIAVGLVMKAMILVVAVVWSLNVEHVVECDSGWRKHAVLCINSLRELYCRPREALNYWRWWRTARLKP